MHAGKTRWTVGQLRSIMKRYGVAGTLFVGAYVFWQEHINPNIVLELESLRWLPNGKSLSFFLNDVLYTVPAD